MNPIAADRYCLEKAETYAWRFEQEKGKNNFWLGKWCFVLAWVLAGFPALPYGWYVTCVVAMLIVIPCIGIVSAVDNLEIWTMARKGNNPMRGDWYLRITVVIFTVYMTFNGISLFLVTALISDVLNIAGIYFACCNSMPPGWKAPEKVRGLKSAREHV